MFPANFEYRCPTSIAEALGLLKDHGENAKLLAGGQSLIPILKLRLAEPQLLVDIGRLAELRGIQETDGSIQIGSLVRHVEIERSQLLARVCPLLPETAAEIGDVQVRNRGTLGGSLAHADPAGDFPAAALALEARLTAASIDGQRSIAAQDFFTGLMMTALRPNEILTSIAVPKQGARSGSAYAKLHQQASGFAIVGVASLVRLDAAGKVGDVRVGITGVADRPYRARGVEERLRGSVPGRKEIRAASALAADGVEPLGDIHASEDYRRDLAAVFTVRSLLKAVERARG
ncbi:MAG: xanthine dehydrogenase family protein subunit M [Acidobacteria bacterium]|nr:xanthine dehydrogenase family protein subunit M [Acidobacteriota bacterium]